jgi:hypothetical protein
MFAQPAKFAHFRNLVLFGLLVCLSLPALANNVSVNCSGGTKFTTITAALNSLDLTGPNTITVSGVCVENVVISRRDRLTIHSVTGQTATIQNAANPAGITVLIAGSHNILLDGLIIEGGGSPSSLYVNSGSNAIQLQNCTIQNSTGDGFDIDSQSEVDIENSTIQNNSASGMFVANSSMVTMGTYPNQHIRITGNGFGGNGNGSAGLNIDGSYVQQNFGVVTISGNAGAGVNMDGGRLLFFGGNADSPAIIENNNYGLVMNDTASATLFSAFLINNNGSTGVSVSGASSITFYGGVDSNGHNAFTTISGHSLVGLALYESSSAQMYGPHVISKNGSANADPGSRGGILLEGSSLAIGLSASVSNNVGPGVRMVMKSDLTMSDMTVSGNTEEGVLETNLSSGAFYNPLTFTGNGGASLKCDAFSVAFGDAGSIAGEQCKNITAGTGRKPQIRIPNGR